MQTFIEQAADVCASADVSAILLLSADGQDIELWHLRPQGARTSPEEFAMRQLRIVGAVGLHGMTPRFTFKESLPLFTFRAFGKAFADYVRSLLGETCAEQLEISELERMYSMPDPRTMN